MVGEFKVVKLHFVKVSLSLHLSVQYLNYIIETVLLPFHSFLSQPLSALCWIIYAFQLESLIILAATKEIPHLALW